MIKKQTLEQWVSQVDYSYLNSSSYIPTTFALSVLNFIKLINGERGEENKTPPIHLSMLDKIETRTSNFIINLCFRGAAKTTLFGEYLILYLAVFRKLPHIEKTVDVMIYIADSMDNGANSLKRNLSFRYENSPFLRECLPEAKFTDNYISFTNRDNQPFFIRLYGATSSIRGIKNFGKRPQLCIIDDIFSDEAAKSVATQTAIKATIYNGVINALDPVNNLIIFNGTPFNKNDIIVEAVESGAWEVSVYPVCEKFPCDKKDFKGAWEDRFTYNAVLEKYNFFKNINKLDSFYQEYMLQLTTEDSKIITNNDIVWYKRKGLLEHNNYYNFYITTDFATSSKTTANNSVILVWALNNNGDWFLVDGICKKQTMDLNIDELFKFVSIYQPQQVGIEVTGQQGAFIDWLRREMQIRNIWFSFASNNNSNRAGIRPVTDKLSRFNLVVPNFKQNKIFFPEELDKTNLMREILDEISLVTIYGIKGSDDCIDAISMLAYIKAIRPNRQITYKQNKNNIWEEDINNLDDQLNIKRLYIE